MPGKSGSRAGVAREHVEDDDVCLERGNQNEAVEDEEGCEAELPERCKPERGREASEEILDDLKKINPDVVISASGFFYAS